MTCSVGTPLPMWKAVATLWVVCALLPLQPPHGVTALDACGGVYCPTSAYTFTPDAVTTTTTGTTCGAAYPADYALPDGVDCATAQAPPAGCQRPGSNPCRRCDDFVGDLVVPVDTVGGSSSLTERRCDDAFPLASVDGIAEGTADCRILQASMDLLGCCASTAGQPGIPCSRCPGGNDNGEFRATHVISGANASTCAEAYPVDTFAPLAAGSAVCASLQTVVVFSNCCQTDDEGCLSETGVFAQCIADHPECADSCDQDSLVVDANLPAADFPGRAAVFCNQTGLSIIESCCPVCAEAANDLFDCSCQEPNDSSGGGSVAAPGWLRVPLYGLGWLLW